MRLIDAHALSTKYKIEYDHADAMGNAHRKKGWQGALQLLYDAPTIEAEPVKHGRWEDDPYDPRFVCQECGKWFLVEDATGDMLYCPNCGCKMDLEGI